MRSYGMVSLMVPGLTGLNGGSSGAIRTISSREKMSSLASHQYCNKMA